MSTDPSEHIGVLHHVVNSATMNIPDHVKDEALSEGYVLLVQAAASYNPRYGVPPHYWIAMKIRNGLKNWKKAESTKHGANVELLVELYEDKWEDRPGVSHVDAIGQHEKRLELEGLVALASVHLNDDQYIALIGPAFGLHMKELSHILKKNPNQIVALQEDSRQLINDMRLL